MNTNEIKNKLMEKLETTGYKGFDQKMVDQHFEGSVFNHTQKCVDAYLAGAQEADPDFLVALILHDCGKDAVTQKVDAAKGTITYPGHAVRSGEIFKSFIEGIEGLNVPLIAALVINHDVIWQLKKSDAVAPEKSKIVKKIQEAVDSIATTIGGNKAKALELLYQISACDEAGNDCTTEKNAKKAVVAIRFRKIFGIPLTSAELAIEAQAD